MGPFAVADLSILDIAGRMRQATASSRTPEARYEEIPAILCQRGRLGRKTSAGYYRYDDKGRRTPDPQVTAVTLAGSEPKCSHPSNSRIRLAMTAPDVGLDHAIAAEARLSGGHPATGENL
jgi:3-hydroxyacyl-CoA dehydrogenase